jgi:FkbM family methyltransferase
MTLKARLKTRLARWPRLYKWVADRAWKTGDRLDRMGRWLLVNRPATARVYASLLSTLRRRPTPRYFPGWTFAYEYYIEHDRLAMRRGTLWEFALERNLEVPLVVRWLGGTRVEVTLGNDNSLCLYVAGSFEPNEFAFLDGVVRPGMTFVDVGANEGYFTLFAARRVGRGGRVVAIEPSSRERLQLERNVLRNRLGNVIVVPHALADAAGTARLQIAAKVHGGHNTFGAFAYADTAAVASEEVPLETLDALVERLSVGRVDVMKIDVEGAELKVLRGGRNLLMSSRPILLIEANDAALRGQAASNEALVELLRELDYEIHVFSDATGRVERLAEGGVLSANIVAFPVNN